MFNLNPDQVAFWGLVVAIVAAVAAIIAAVAAIWTLVYAKDAPTKGDLARVEQNTAHLEMMNHRLYKQQELENINARAQRVSITVNGDNPTDRPFLVGMVLKDPEVTLTRVELLNQLGNLFGGGECKHINALTYQVSIDSRVMMAWYLAGVMNQYGRRLLQLRVYMILDGREVYREFTVYLIQANRRDMDTNDPCQVFILDGSA